MSDEHSPVVRRILEFFARRYPQVKPTGAYDCPKPYDTLLFATEDGEAVRVSVAEWQQHSQMPH